MATPRKKLWDSWERDAWAPPPQIQVDEWAEANIVLPRAVGQSSGPISWDVIPFAREILRASTDPDVEEITLCFSAQTAKSTICQAIILYYLAEDPWPCMHVMAREDDAFNTNTDRYQKILEASPSLARFLTGQAHDLTRETIRINGTTLRFAGANSPAALASWPVAILNLDETDKYPEFSGREADPIALARERTTTFSNRKILKTSTPTTRRGYIWREFEDGDQRRYHVPCPRCGHYQELVFGHVRVPDGERDQKRIVDEQLAWYECAACHDRIRDAEKPWMLRRGVWCPRGCSVTHDGKLEGRVPSRRRLSYHLSRLYAPWANATWSHVFAEFLRAKDVPKDLMNFRNSWLAEVWEDTVDELKGEHLRQRKKPYRMGEPPRRGIVATAGVDVQAHELWHVVRIWGHGCESWLYRAGPILEFSALRQVLDQPIVVDGRRIPLKQVFVDVGYNERMDEVLRWCRETGATPARGASNPTLHLHVKNYDSAIGAMALAWIDTGYFKDRIHRLVRSSDKEPHAWHLPHDCPEEYFRHLTAEQKVPVTNKKTGRLRPEWKVIPSGADNHLLDCEVYATAAAELAGVEFLQPLPGASAEPEAAPSADTMLREPAPVPTTAPQQAPRRRGPHLIRANIFRR